MIRGYPVRLASIRVRAVRRMLASDGPAIRPKRTKGSTPSRNRVSDLYTLPMPHSASCLRRATPMGSSGRATKRRVISSKSGSSASRSGPKRDKNRCHLSWRAVSSSTTGALKHTATCRGVWIARLACRCGRRHDSPALYRCHEPVIRMCVYRTIPSSK